MHNNESEMSIPESFEQRVAQLKQQWEGALREVVAQRMAIHSESEHPIEDASFLPQQLEQLTLPKEAPLAKFIVLTAPSGVGKGTVGRYLEAAGIGKLPRINTRPRRPDEVEGQDYNFVSDSEYGDLVAKGKVFCLTSTAEESQASSSALSDKALHTRAAISINEFEKRLAQDVPFYIDAGAGTARKIKNEPVVQGMEFATVFLLPPSFDELVQRLNKRRREEAARGESTMSDETALDRLAIAVNHLRDSRTTADGYVVNDIPERAAQQIRKFIHTQTVPRRI